MATPAEVRIALLEKENCELRSTVASLQKELQRVRVSLNSASEAANDSFQNLLSLLPLQQQALANRQSAFLTATQENVAKMHAEQEEMSAQRQRQQELLEQQEKRMSQERDEYDRQSKEQELRHQKQSEAVSHMASPARRPSALMAAMNVESPPEGEAEVIAVEVEDKDENNNHGGKQQSQQQKEKTPSPAEANYSSVPRGGFLSEEAPRAPAPTPSHGIIDAVVAGSALVLACDTPNLVRALQLQHKREQELQQLQQQSAADVRTRLFQSSPQAQDEEEEGEIEGQQHQHQQQENQKPRSSNTAAAVKAVKSGDGAGAAPRGGSATPLQSLARSLEMDSALRGLLDSGDCKKNKTATAAAESPVVVNATTPKQQLGKKPVNFDSI